MKLPAGIPLDPAAIAEIFTGRKAASILGGVLLAVSLPPEQFAHLTALAGFLTGGQPIIAAAVMLGLSAYGSAKSAQDSQPLPAEPASPGASTAARQAGAALEPKA